MEAPMRNETRTDAISTMSMYFSIELQPLASTAASDISLLVAAILADAARLIAGIY